MYVAIYVNKYFTIYLYEGSTLMQVCILISDVQLLSNAPTEHENEKGGVGGGGRVGQQSRYHYMSGDQLIGCVVEHSQRGRGADIPPSDSSIDSPAVGVIAVSR